MDDSPVEILVIESDPVLSDLIQLSLEQQDYQVMVTRTKREALTAFKRFHPPVVLLDLFLQQTNALELIALLKKETTAEPFALIVLSSFAYREVIEKALQAGATDYLLKPLDVDRLMERVNKILAEIRGPKISKPKFQQIF